MEFDEKELRKEISYAIKNIHGIRHVPPPTHTSNTVASISSSLHHRPSPQPTLISSRQGLLGELPALLNTDAGDCSQTVEV